MTTRLALTAGQSAHARREICSGPLQADAVDLGHDPSRVAERGEALELGLLALLEKLSATERAAYVLREAFEYPHRRIAEVLGLSEANARQLVTRARGRLCGERRRRVGAAEHRRLLDTFVAAAQTGDLASLERLLVAEIAISLLKRGELVLEASHRVPRNRKCPQLTRATPSAASSASDGACGRRTTFTGPRTSDMKRRSASVSHRAIGYTQSTPASR